MNEKLSFAIKNAELISEDRDSNFSVLSLDFFSSGKNLNDSYISEETLERTADTIKNCPVVWKYSSMFNDAGSHHKDEVPCGFIPKEAEIKQKKLEDGRVMLTTISYVWKKFSGQILEFFERDGDKPISVEMTVYDYKDMGDGIKELLDYRFDAVTVLGSLVTPGISGAHATVLQFAKEYDEAYRNEFFARYENVDMSIPDAVKKNVAKGLELYKQHNKGGTSVSLASARYIAKSDIMTPEKIRHVAKVHKSNKFQNKIKSPPNEGYISYMLYGGQDGMNWAIEVSKKLDEHDAEQLSYFSDELTFPYKSLKDINPALAGIDPPITLGQANAIARQADAISSDDEKNGWAIAISKFKRSHKVVDGKWVKKDKMSYDFSLNSAQILEVLNAYLSGYTYGENKYCKYWVQAYDSDEGYVFFRDSEEGKGYRAKYNLTGAECTIDLASKEEVISAGFMPVKEKINMEDVEKKKEEMAEESKEVEKKEEMAAEPEKKEEEKPAEEKKEEMSAEDEKKEEEKEEEEKPEEEKKEEMSLDQNMDVAATLAMLANETDAFSGLVKNEFSKVVGERDYAKMFEAMCGKMSQMAEENKNLKSFKASMEQKQFDFEVNSTMKYIEEKTTMPKDQRDALIEESKKFSLETVDGWKNLAKAKGLDFAIKDEKEDGILRFANPWGTKDIKKSLWD